MESEALVVAVAVAVVVVVVVVVVVWWLRLLMASRMCYLCK